jgi:hypothetical protein
MQPPLHRVALALAVTVAGVGFAACGGDDSSSSDTTEASSSDTTEASSDDTSSAETSGASTDSTESSGSGNDQVDAWAGAVCGAVGSWLTGINDLGAQLSTDVQGIADLEEGRDLLVTFMEDVVGLTDDMLGSVEDAGAPDIERGDELAADLVAALEPVKTTFEDAVVEAQNLPTDDADTFSAAATELGNSITGSQGEFQAQFDALQQEYDSPEINAAFETVPACAQVG